MKQPSCSDDDAVVPFPAFATVRPLVITLGLRASSRVASLFPELDHATSQIVRGRRNVLNRLPLLERLAEQFGQSSAMCQLEYFMTLPWALKKIPYLVTVSSSSPRSTPSAKSAFPSRPKVTVHRFPVSSLMGAVIVYEYAIKGIGTGVFATDDDSGTSCVLAPEEMRPRIAMLAAQTLLRQSAQIVLISCRTNRDRASGFGEDAAASVPGSRWATRWREMRDSLPLCATYDETLATLGKHTRRNLRYYRRRAEKELGVEFIADARRNITAADFHHLNLNSTHPVTPEEAARRFASIDNLNQGFLAGLRRTGGDQTGGEWLSLAGGWHYGSESWIEWQLNRNGLEQNSISTVMRSYMLESFVGRGTKSLSFLGGTPHSMQESFPSRWTLDIILRRRNPEAALVCGLANRVFRTENRLRQALADPDLSWTEA